MIHSLLFMFIPVTKKFFNALFLIKFTLFLT